MTQKGLFENHTQQERVSRNFKNQICRLGSQIHICPKVNITQIVQNTEERKSHNILFVAPRPLLHISVKATGVVDLASMLVWWTWLCQIGAGVLNWYHQLVWWVKPTTWCGRSGTTSWCGGSGPTNWYGGSSSHICQKGEKLELR